MKKILMVLVAGLVLAGGLNAQNAPAGERKPAENPSQVKKEQPSPAQRPSQPLRANLYREINQVPALTNEQKQEINKLRTEYFKLQRELMQAKAEDAKMKTDLEAKMKEHQKAMGEMFKANKEQSDYYSKNIAGKTYTWEKPMPVQRPATEAKPADPSKPAVPPTPGQPAPATKKEETKKQEKK